MSEAITVQDVRIILWVPLSITTLTCGLRFFVRAKLRSFGYEDIFFGIAWIFYLISMIAAEVDTDLPWDDQQRRISAYFVGYLCGFLSLCASKFGIALALLRLWGGVKDWRRRFLLANMMVFFMLSLLGLIGAVTVSDCPGGQNHPAPGSFACVSVNAFVGLSFVSPWTVDSAIVDLVFSFLGTVTVYKHKTLRRRTKIGLFTVFALGCCACPFAILRQFGPIEYITLSTTLEISLLVIGASIPTLTPLYDWWRHGKALRPRRAQNARSTAQGKKTGPAKGDEKIDLQNHGQSAEGHRTESTTELVSLPPMPGHDHRQP